jgi:hypothetical protein
MNNKPNIILIALLLLFVHSKGQRVVIIGIAVNEKDGAWVIKNKGTNAFFIEGLNEWDSSFEGKVIRVKGDLLIQKLKEIPQEPGLPYPQQAVGVKQTIKNAKWEIVNLVRNKRKRISRKVNN